MYECFAWVQTEIVFSFCDNFHVDLEEMSKCVAQCVVSTASGGNFIHKVSVEHCQCTVIRANTHPAVL